MNPHHTLSARLLSACLAGVTFLFWFSAARAQTTTYAVTSTADPGNGICVMDP